ncbi:MAG: tetratricopeptide repeat protein [Flavobacteriales bacterium]|nr:tetratricopeptide repeat protein [Flavobacteriales bacterium]
MLRQLLLAFFLLISNQIFAQTAAESFAKGVQLADEENYSDALTELNAALKEDKDNVKYLLKRGDVKYLSGKSILAIQDYNKVIQLDAKNSEAYASRSAIYIELKDYKSAIEDCQKAIAINPKNEMAYIRMGDALISQEPKDWIEAMKTYNYAINLNPNNPKALHNRGRAKRELKDYYGAIDDFNKAILLDAEFGSAYMNRGIAKSLVGDTPGACIDWYLAGEMGEAEAADYITTRCKQ